jgi:inner membrane protein
MCSVITHPVVPIAISAFLPQSTASPKLIIAGAICSIIPDLDVIGFSFGIRYEDMLGHRGFTHSVCFALLLGALAALTLFRGAENHWLIFLFLFLSTLSHPLLDALTDGGLGVAFFSPLSNERYFFWWRPIKVSPIGVGSFFSQRGLEILANEMGWIWLPSGIAFLIGQAIRRYW